jgi:ADP-ribosylglycohydrolase
MKRSLDYLKACILAGAIGDALGWPIEFKSYEEILQIYGKSGCTKLKANQMGIVEVTDDTQMTLFTLEGIANCLYFDTFSSFAASVWNSYLRWHKTQSGMDVTKKSDFFDLMSYPQLFFQRSPGNTCLSALRGRIMGTVENPFNDSKGCGGVMRVAPVGYFFKKDEAFEHGCIAAALTHGHPLGYLSSGALAYMISLIFDGENLRVAGLKTIEKLQTIPKATRQIELLNQALKLSESDKSDIYCINELGEGWVGEEALAISVYCSLKYSDDLNKALVTSVNHSGDSDSTGSITGNILGAYLGMTAIDTRLLEKLDVTEIVMNFLEFIEHHDKS